MMILSTTLAAFLAFVHVQTVSSFLHRPACCPSANSVQLPSKLSVLRIPSDSDSSPDARELLGLLLKKINYRTTRQEVDRIEELMDSLQDQHAPFYEDTYLNGPLYTVAHQMGPKPFWQRFDISSDTNKNIKGNRFTSAGGHFDVLNFAQFAGEKFYITGEGICQQYEKTNDASSLSPLVHCPVDYTIQVTGASFILFGRRFDIDIEGAGYLRVLYADENIPIFSSFKDTTNKKIMEKVGLRVAQVRFDLVDPSFTLPEAALPYV